MNERRGVEKDPQRTIQPGALYAMGLIDELSHALVEYYRKRLDPKVMAGALEWFDSRIGRAELDKTILAFVEQFPSTDVYRNEKTSVEWLAGETDGHAHRAVAFEEMMLLWLANANPAFNTVFRAVQRSVPRHGDTVPANYYRAARIFQHPASAGVKEAQPD